MKKYLKIILIMICILLFNTIVYANSAPTYWTDYPSTGIMAVDKNTPIEVLKENLLFDFTMDYENSYSPSAKVEAVYEMKNTSDEIISVKMAFPFIERFSELSLDDIKITADDEVIPYNVYLGDVVQESGYPFQEPKNTDYNIDNILQSIGKKKYLANNFKENDLGKLYKFNVSSIDDNINFALSFDFNSEKTKIILNGFNRFERDDDNNIRIASHIRKDEPLDEPLEIYVLGEDINFDIKGYTNGSLEEETDKFEYEIIIEDIDIDTYLKELANYYLKEYDSNENVTNSHMSEVQLYNLYAESLDKYLDKNLGICTEEDIRSQTWSIRIITLVYTVEFPKNSNKEVSVSYKTNGTMDRRKTVEPQFTYEYILNPARNWKDFNNLNIKIITPKEAPYIINSSVELKKDDNNVYKAYLEELPEEDFFFTLYSKEKVTLSDRVKGYLNRTFGYFTSIAIGFIVILIVIILNFMFFKYRRKKTN